MPGRVRLRGVQNITGRVGSGGVQHLTARVGSYDLRDRGHVAGRATLIRKLFSADPQVGPADPARGSDISTRLSGADAPFVSNSYIQTPPNIYVHVHIGPYPIIPDHTPLSGTPITTKYFSGKG